jgi:hypothetical protein
MSLSRGGGTSASTVSHNNGQSPHRSHSFLEHSSSHSMAILSTVATLLLALPALAQDSGVTIAPGGGDGACSKLKSRYPQNTFLRGTPGYAYETQTRECVLDGEREQPTDISQHTGRQLCTAHRHASSFHKMLSKSRSR